MKKIGLLLILCIAFLVSAYTINAGVTVDNIPKTFFGSWRVEAILVESNENRVFKPQSVDLWNLSRVGNVLKLENPFTGASAEVSLKATEGNLVVFSKSSNWDNQVLKDTVSLRLENDTFTGINDVVLETHSLFDNHVIKKCTARYKIKGKKLSGNTLLK